MEKVYTLPDFPAAPYSEVQALAKRLIEFADFSTLVPLFDLLKEQGRTADLEKLQTVVASVLRQIHNATVFRTDWWEDWAYELDGVFFFDLWDLRGISSYLLSAERVERQPYPNNHYTATEAIPSGAIVQVHRQNRTVCIHPNPPQEQQ